MTYSKSNLKAGNQYDEIDMHIGIRDLDIDDEPPADQVALIGIINGGINPEQFGYDDNEIAAVASQIKSEEGQVTIIKIDPSLIKRMPNVCEKAQLMAVKIKSDNIKWIKNPANSAQIHSVTINPENLKWIKNPCKEAQMITARNIVSSIGTKTALQHITDKDAVQALVDRFQVQEIMES